jgi:hypothetical protein
LHPRDHVVRPGHQLAFHINAGHSEFQPYPTMTDVTITEASVTVPFLTYDRLSNLAGTGATASAYTKKPTAEQASSSQLDMPLPTPVPVPDEETREHYQPTVTTPGG